MKCPVCEETIEHATKKCPNCGFEDLRTEFINENELEMWRTYVVYPCKFAYQTAVAQRREFERTLQKALSTIKDAPEVQYGVESSMNNGTPSFKKLDLNENSEWVTKGNITYKTFYKCKVKTYSACEISNIVLETVGNRMVADFFVKKIHDFGGADATYFIAFKWKLKDDYGIVVADGRWSNDKMQIGDVTKGSISIRGIDPSIQYVLEFAND